MKRFADFVFEKVSGKLALAFTLLYIIAGVAMMQWGEQQIRNYSGGKSIRILDLSFTGYSPEEVNTWLSEYTPEARKFAATFNATADSVYPVLYTAMLTFLLAWVYKNRIEPNSPVRYMVLLPLLMMLLDFAENFHIISMLKLYPEIPAEIVKAGSVFTILKWGLFVVIILLLAAGLFIRRKKPGNQ
jgi:hypothetical protein